MQYRLSGPDIQGVREKSRELANIVAKNPNLGDVTFDWGEPARVIKVNVLQDKARSLGVSSQDIASTLNSVVNGAVVTQIRDDIYLVDVVARAKGGERASVDTLQNLQLPGSGGTSVPLAAVASVDFALEQPTIWRRARLPTVTLKISVLGDVQPATVVQQLAPEVKKFADALPAGYQVKVGGAVEESGKAQGPINAVFPLMIFIMATILMIQLQSFSRLFLVFAVAPLAMIGVSAALLASHKPMGFVAILGVLALIGILIRNSVILIIQIETLLKEGVSRLGRGARGDPAPHAPDHAHGGCGHPGADPDLARDLLGADGLCDDGRHHRRHGFDLAVPARALPRVVPHPRAGRQGQRRAASGRRPGSIPSPSSELDFPPEQRHLYPMAQARFLIWGGGLTVAALFAGLVLLALVLWALYGPLVFVNALNAAWTCF